MKLYTAIVKEINEQKKFTAYEITKSLRDKVNNSSLIVEDTDEITLPNGQLVGEVDHQNVNDIIKDIYENKILDLNRTNGRGYFTYELVSKTITLGTTYNNPTLTAHLAQVAKVMKTVKPNWVQPVAKPAQQMILMSFTKSERHTIYTKVASYVANKRKNKESATLKGISSAVKTPGLTVKDINDVCSKLGYKVTQKVPLSFSEVK